ncbi:D-alanyl-D-alanine carboxypeptidase family protein [Hyphomicrobium sp. NDB2Meth4]|uniref:D-alanyl-D-alanine carboxypeptidase family protein n=1 Tax=Hyphomicrobium sp. NDB2Meth4 TaxID=1892846 RepID=UPI0009306A13|nr:D-alanyl-D-alanine carboxypeptidase family protein [Hyphomicrobium sp. NDB2Meth4]
MRRGTAFVALLLLAVMAPRGAAAGPALVVELSNSKVLFAEDADAVWHPASLTKMMTAYLVFEALKAGKVTLKSKVTCSAAAHEQPPSKIGLAIGRQMSVDLALQSLIVKSANDVAMMLAETVGGSEAAFVEMMNAKARALGMDRTFFVNPNGLPAPAQVTTARDLAKLARAVINDFPEYAHYWQKSEMRLGKQRLVTHNGLLQSFAGADGMKTGFTCDSGFNVVATATRDGRRVIAVVLGENSSAERNIRAASLLEHGFHQTGWKQLFNSTTIDNMPLAPAVGVRSVRNDVVSWGCSDRKARVAKSKARKKKKDAVAAAKKKKPAVKADEPETVTVDVDRGDAAAQGDDAAPATVQLRGTMPPPAAAAFQPQQ